MSFHRQNIPRGRLLSLSSLLLLILLLAGCGGAASSSGVSSSAAPQAANSASSSSNAAANSAAAKTASSPARQPASPGPRYLAKTLKVDMQVKDTRRAADDLQTWISTSDPLATSEGTSYQQEEDNIYTVSLTYAVQASIYPRIQRYLRDYASAHAGQLITMNESVQDVTNDYVDTQSRLTTLKTEQARLLTLMSHAQALDDVLSIEQRLTAVEQQIESTESQLKTLSSQVTFYTVTISLEPIASELPQPAPPAWNIGQVFHDAFAASWSFALSLLTFLIWLLAFSIYIVPSVLIIWFVVRFRKRLRRFPAPKMPAMTPPSAS